MACCWLLKGLGTTLMMILFFMAYFHLLAAPVTEPLVMPQTWVDRQVVFEPAFFYLYASLWVYVSLVPALMPDRATLVRYGLAIGALCLAGLAVFLAFPTSIERDPTLWAGEPAFAWLAAVDSSGNAFPSLHVATALFSAFWMDRLIRAIGMPDWWRVVSALWALGIVYSTLAIAQHVFLDVVGGVILALAFVWLSANRLSAAGMTVARDESSRDRLTVSPQSSPKVDR
ncbi:phosphatase PAP2 family protein [Guyparkeria halophila]|uniref:Phosphatase PAP2 family protein n=2 Tax=Guyparkeria halophila TaxID=47960 RepID=A0A6I6CW97_9GAMM|nr:phosphatase PAP2 family protein [Guyparkeria halophila]